MAAFSTSWLLGFQLGNQSIIELTSAQNYESGKSKGE